MRRSLVGAVLAGLTVAGAACAQEQTKEKPAKGVPAGAVEVRFTDGSTLKLTLRDERIDFLTPYGKLAVPVADVRRIEFATRISDDTSRRINQLIAALGSKMYREREDASAALLALREKAYPALQAAAKSSDSEVVHRAETLLKKIQDSVPEELLEVRPHDVLFTDECKFTGKVESPELKAVTAQFGEVSLKLIDMRSLRWQGTESEQALGPVIADPGNMTPLEGQMNKTFAIRVTGAANGSVWGTDVYTIDSNLATAAVHAGVLQMGQTAVIKVTVVASPPAFQGSVRNGVTSSGYGQYRAAFKVHK